MITVLYRSGRSLQGSTLQSEGHKKSDSAILFFYVRSLFPSFFSLTTKHCFRHFHCIYLFFCTLFPPLTIEAVNKSVVFLFLFWFVCKTLRALADEILLRGNERKSLSSRRPGSAAFAHFQLGNATHAHARDVWPQLVRQSRTDSQLTLLRLCKRRCRGASPPLNPVEDTQKKPQTSLRKTVKSVSFFLLFLSMYGLWKTNALTDV